MESIIIEKEVDKIAKDRFEKFCKTQLERAEQSISEYPFIDLTGHFSNIIEGGRSMIISLTSDSLGIRFDEIWNMSIEYKEKIQALFRQHNPKLGGS